jgi:hypothetical protein
MSEQTQANKRAIDFLGKEVRRQYGSGAQIPLKGGIAIVVAIRTGGICELQCPCCQHPAGQYSSMDLELVP